MQFAAKIKEENWSGVANIPVEYLPPNVTLMNAYAIHGSGAARQYEALYPATKEFDEPNL